MIKQNNFLYYCLLLTIILSNISQLPSLIENGTVQLFSTIPWLLLLFFTFIINIKEKRLYFYNQNGIFYYTTIFFIVCLILEGINRRGLSVCLLRPLFICIMVYCIANNLINNIEKSKLYGLIIIYILSSFALSFFIYQDIVSRKFVWEGMGYAYLSKNSASQIIITSIFLILFINGKNNPFFNIFLYFALGFETLLLLMMKSRASILCLVIIAISIFKSKEYKSVTKNIIILIILIFIGYMLFNANYRDFMLNNIVYAGRDVNDLDSLSSGRYGQINDFSRLFSLHPLIGYGRFYIESFPLDAFLETGILGGIPINIIALIPIFYSIKNYIKYKRTIDFLLMMLSLCYYTNGLFEQLSPFGPGVKCYFLWLIFGLSVGWRYKYENPMDN